jgi:hypothetical protein
MPEREKHPFNIKITNSFLSFRVLSVVESGSTNPISTQHLLFIGSGMPIFDHMKTCSVDTAFEIVHNPKVEKFHCGFFIMSSVALPKKILKTRLAFTKKINFGC